MACVENDQCHSRTAVEWCCSKVAKEGTVLVSELEREMEDLGFK